MQSATTTVARRSKWHRKAKWALRKVLIKTPTDSVQMRQVCNDLIERRLGNQSMSAAVVNTALKLWEDERLVRALYMNPTFQSAKERIQTLSAHILPHHAAIAGTMATSMHRSDNAFNDISFNPGPSFFEYSNKLVHTTIAEAVFRCSVCGNHLQCQHDGSSIHTHAHNHSHAHAHAHSHSHAPSSRAHVHDPLEVSVTGCSPLPDVVEDNALRRHQQPQSQQQQPQPQPQAQAQAQQQVSRVEHLDDDVPSVGTAGRTPYDNHSHTYYTSNSDPFENKRDYFSSSSSSSSSSSHELPFSGEMDDAWFGPLVLASLAVLGLAMGIFSGDIATPRQLSSVTSRAVTAVSMVMQASNSVFRFLRQ